MQRNSFLVLVALLVVSLVFLFGCTSTPVCGNGVCEAGEDAELCSSDCGFDNNFPELGGSPSSCQQEFKLGDWVVVNQVVPFSPIFNQPVPGVNLSGGQRGKIFGASRKLNNETYWDVNLFIADGINVEGPRNSWINEVALRKGVGVIKVCGDGMCEQTEINGSCPQDCIVIDYTQYIDVNTASEIAKNQKFWLGDTVKPFDSNAARLRMRIQPDNNVAYFANYRNWYATSYDLNLVGVIKSPYPIRMNDKNWYAIMWITVNGNERGTYAQSGNGEALGGWLAEEDINIVQRNRRECTDPYGNYIGGEYPFGWFYERTVQQLDQAKRASINCPYEFYGLDANIVSNSFNKQDGKTTIKFKGKPNTIYKILYSNYFKVRNSSSVPSITGTGDDYWFLMDENSDTYTSNALGDFTVISTENNTHILPNSYFGKQFRQYRALEETAVIASGPTYYYPMSVPSKTTGVISPAQQVGFTRNNFCRRGIYFIGTPGWVYEIQRSKNFCSECMEQYPFDDLGLNGYDGVSYDCAGICFYESDILWETFGSVRANSDGSFVIFDELDSDGPNYSNIMYRAVGSLVNPPISEGTASNANGLYVPI